MRVFGRQRGRGIRQGKCASSKREKKIPVKERKRKTERHGEIQTEMGKRERDRKKEESTSDIGEIQRQSMAETRATMNVTN